MALADLFLDKTGNSETLSLTRTTAIATTVILATGFLLLSWKGKASWEVFVAFPMGVSLTLAPQLFLRLIDNLKEAIKAWKGGSE